MVISHVGVKHMAHFLDKQGSTMWAQFGGVWGKQIPNEWKPTIGVLVHDILSQKVGVVFKTKKEDVLARKFLESVRDQSRKLAGSVGETRLSNLDEKKIAEKMTVFAAQMEKKAREEGFGAKGAVKIWEEIETRRQESFETMKIRGKNMTNRNKSSHQGYHYLNFQLEALNAVLRRALKMEQTNAYKSRVQIVVFIGLLIIAASILVYSRTKIYRFARTQFRKMMKTWRRLLGRPAIYDTLNKIESSGSVKSPRELNIHNTLQSITFGSGFTNKSRSHSSRFNDNVELGESRPRIVQKKSPKTKWIDFTVVPPTRR